MTFARLDIITGLLEREVTQLYVLPMASGETLPILKEMLVELTLGWRPLITWVLITKITDEFILGLDVLHIPDESVDLEPLVLQQGEKGGAVVVSWGTTMLIPLHEEKQRGGSNLVL